MKQVAVWALVHVLCQALVAGVLIADAEDEPKCPAPAIPMVCIAILQELDKCVDVARACHARLNQCVHERSVLGPSILEEPVRLRLDAPDDPDT